MTALVLLLASSLDWHLGLQTFLAGLATAAGILILERLLPWEITKDIIALLGVLFLCWPRQLPTADSLIQMPWWAPLGGVIGSFAVVAGLIFVSQVGAGAFAGLAITANILMSLVIDKFGLFGMAPHALSLGRMAGAALMVAGIALISSF